tara:strand:+ start:131 stop:502 length:372 start_codon:yes stop_codon:yes gene_type:complete
MNQFTFKPNEIPSHLLKINPHLSKEIVDCPPDPTSNLESNSRDAPISTKKAQGYDTRCRIHIHSVRKRLADPDGVSGKAAIDGLVHSGILEDDSAKFVSSVTYSQEKTKKGESEKTIMTLDWN